MQLLDNQSLNPKQRKLAELIDNRFNSINQAHKALGFSRQAIYNWIENGEVSPLAKDVLRGRGWNPDTLKKL